MVGKETEKAFSQLYSGCEQAKKKNYDERTNWMGGWVALRGESNAEKGREENPRTCYEHWKHFRSLVEDEHKVIGCFSNIVKLPSNLDAVSEKSLRGTLWILKGQSRDSQSPLLRYKSLVVSNFSVVIFFLIVFWQPAHVISFGKFFLLCQRVERNDRDGGELCRSSLCFFY